MSAPLTVSLRPHPATPCPAVAAIEVRLARQESGDLRLDYRIATDPATLRLPAPQPSGPADNLWQHTCCEAFITGPGASYREFNFSPSGQWAVYDFSDIRQRNAAYVPAATPTITCAADDAGLSLSAHLPATLLPAGDTPHLGLSAVIETTAGHLSYWALIHTDAKPDFHRREAFTFLLPCKLGNGTPRLQG